MKCYVHLTERLKFTESNAPILPTVPEKKKHIFFSLPLGLLAVSSHKTLHISCVHAALFLISLQLSSLASNLHTNIHIRRIFNPSSPLPLFVPFSKRVYSQAFFPSSVLHWPSIFPGSFCICLLKTCYKCYIPAQWFSQLPTAKKCAKMV